MPCVPGLKVIAPYTAADAKGLLKAAIRNPNPVIFLENEILYGQSFDVPGHGRFRHRAHRQGQALRKRAATSPLFPSRAAWPMLEAAEELAEEGIDAEVIDLRTLRPLDMDNIILASVKKTNRLVVVEEGWPVCSVGSEICAAVIQPGLRLPRCTAITSRPARMCRCLMLPIWKHWHCRTPAKLSMR